MELTGKISVTFEGSALNALCRRLIPSYEENRFNVVAVRAYSGKEKFITFFLADRDNTSTTLPPGKYPVKKFKVELESLLPLLEASTGFNFTCSSDDYHLDDMEVTNK
jgi:hypothetical protein